MFHHISSFNSTDIDGLVETTSSLSFDEKQILCQIHRTAKRAYAENKTRKQWTTLIKSALFDLGRSKHFRVFPGTHEMEKEWLFDTVWLRSGEGFESNQFVWNGYAGIHLALESEFSVT